MGLLTFLGLKAEPGALSVGADAPRLTAIDQDG
jgi:hypothetical protein